MASSTEEDFHRQAHRIVEIYGNSDFSYDDQRDELDIEVDNALQLLKEIGKGDHFTFSDVFSFFSDMANLDIIYDISPEDLRYRVNQDILVEPFNYEFWFMLGILHGFGSMSELGNGTVHYFKDLPDGIRQEFSKYAEYGVASTKSNGKRVTEEWYLRIVVKSIGAEKARQKAIIELKKSINILKFFYDSPNAMYYFDTASIIDYCVKSEDDNPKMWAGREHSARPLSRSFIIKDGDISSMNAIVRNMSKSELESRIVNAIDVYGMIEESTPVNIRFLLCVIALEGMLLAGKEEKKSKNLARRVSLLVGDTPEWLAMHHGIQPGLETKEIDDKFVKTRGKEMIEALENRTKAMYEKRNSFAHEGLRGNDEITTDDFIFAGTILKWTVKRALELANQGFDRISKGNKADEMYLDRYFNEKESSYHSTSS